MRLHRNSFAGLSLLAIVAASLTSVMGAGVAQAAQTITVSNVTCTASGGQAAIVADLDDTLTFTGAWTGCDRVIVRPAIVDDSSAFAVTVSSGTPTISSVGGNWQIEAASGQTITGLSIRLKNQAVARTAFAVSIDNQQTSRMPVYASYWDVTVGSAPNPTPPTPAPVFPPSGPTEAKAEAGDGSATVTWGSPASQGSFPVSNYQVQTTPSSSGCLVPAAVTSCTLAGLRNGTTYAVQVRALNGAGWGAWADAGNVTPRATAQPSIVISGSRSDDGRLVLVQGSATELDGQTLQSWLRLGGDGSFRAGSTRVVGAEGAFEWQRATRKKVTLYFATTDGAVRSNVVTVPAR